MTGIVTHQHQPTEASARSDKDMRLSRLANLDAPGRPRSEVEISVNAASPGPGDEGHQRGALGTQDARPGEADLIRLALATDDECAALATMARPVRGIYHFGPAMSSVILAAYRPTMYIIADTRALRAVRARASVWFSVHRRRPGTALSRSAFTRGHVTRAATPARGEAPAASNAWQRRTSRRPARPAAGTARAPGMLVPARRTECRRRSG